MRARLRYTGPVSAADRSRDRLAWAPAALALAVFAVVGVAVLDDYGPWVDARNQRHVGKIALNSVLPGAGDLPADRTIPGVGLPPGGPTEHYGAAFEAPLVLVERLLRLSDSRAVFLTRHLLTHLFFLTGGLFCYLLVYRLFGDRWLALFALLLFLLHPRLYAHSFFNSKDLPFLAQFMIALYLLERAFRRGAAGAFALCGAGVGVLVNLRVMGLTLFAAAVGLRALDLLQARGGAARGRVLATTAAFVLTACGTVYALSPYLRSDPLAFVDTVTTLARHPVHVRTFFQGEWVKWPSIPAHYVPTWIAITTPPATLLLCLTGAAAVLRRGAARPRSAAGNTRLRFALLLVVCLALPPAAIVVLRANVSNGWRHLYFLYAPLCLLAVYGLRALAGAAAARSPAGRPRRYAVAALAALALAGTAVEMVRLHPFQQAYFNFLVDRRTPQRLLTRYQLYGRFATLEGLKFLLKRYPDSELSVETHLGDNSMLILPAAARRRIAGESPADFHVKTFAGPTFGPVIYARRVYANTVLEVVAVDLALVDTAAAGHYRAVYRAARAGEPVLRWEFDLYLDGRTLTGVKEPCRPEDTSLRFALQFVPAAAEDLPPPRLLRLRPRGTDFRFAASGVRFDGRCLIRTSLPGSSVRAFEVGRYFPGAGRVIEAVVDLSAAAPAARLLLGADTTYWAEDPYWSETPHWQAHAAIAAGERGAPAWRGEFDLYLDAAGAVLTYHKQPCAPEDLRERFYLHVFPADPAELAAAERQSGFYNRSFAWGEHGTLFGAACVAPVPLPAYEGGVAGIRTSQSNKGWRAEFPAGK